MTIAQIMSLIIRPYYPRYGRTAVQNCTEQGSNRCDLTAGPTGGLLGFTRRTGLPGRAARGSAFPRKATCQGPASDYSQLVQGRRRAHAGGPLGIQLPRRLTEKVSQESVTSEPNNGSQDNHGGADYRGDRNKGRCE